MRRQFTVVEIFIGNLSGQIGGYLSVAEGSNVVDELEWDGEEFHTTAGHHLAELTDQQRNAARSIARELIENDDTISDDDQCLVISASRADAANNQSQQILATFLSQVQRTTPNQSSQTQPRQKRRLG